MGERSPPSSHVDPLDLLGGAGESAAMAALDAARAGPARERILVAESSAEMGDYVRRLLDTRWSVELVFDGREALGRARENPPHLIVSAVQLPTLNGLSLLHELRAAPRTAAIPVILLGASSGPEASIEAFETGADDYVARPFGAPELVARVGARLAAARARREADARFRRAADSTPIIMWVTDPDGHNIFVNRAFLDFVGISAEEGETFDWTQAVHPRDREAYTEKFQAALRERRPFRARMRARRHDGRWRWLESRGNPQLDAAGELVSFFGCSPDVTEILESQQALEEADRRKDEFLAMLAHELRNPIASVMSGSRLLRRLPATSPEVEATRDMIEREVRQLTRLVDDLLDVSRITAGRIELRREMIDLRSVVNRAIEASRGSVEDRRHRLAVSLPGEALPVEGDAARLTQVISNLLNNAAKYTQKGGEIRVMVEAVNAQAWIHVTDTGIGIAPEDLPRIFELFNRVERSQDYAEGGLGVGLTLSRRLVEMHGGSVAAQSEGPGRGSEFVVCLPLAAVAARPEEHAPGIRAPMHRRILLIDDNVPFASAMSSLLKLKGHEVHTIHEGAVALATAREVRPQVVLLDIGLPGMRGHDVARELRADATLSPMMIIAMTGYGQDRDQRRSRSAGIDHHLTKPIDDDALTALIEASPTG
jgi:PAS domain S-box-containing protein